MANPLDFSGKHVLVTGGSRGIGRGIAEAFLDAGAEVIVCGRNEPKTLPTARNCTASFVAANIRDPEAVDTLISTVMERWGRLDVLINNAGGAPPADTASASPRFLQSIIDLNLTAPLLVSQRAWRELGAQERGGVIINIGSVAALRPAPTVAAYAAAKAGLLNLTKTLAVEWAPSVRVNAVVPGMVATPEATAHFGDAETQAALANTVPLGRLGNVQDVAGACLFLASDLAGYVSGAHLVVDGGGEAPAFLKALGWEPSSP